MLISMFQMMGGTIVAMLLGALVLHTVPRLGAAGRRLSGHLCEAPGLDLVISYFTALPWIVGIFGMGLDGLIGAVIGQIISVIVWTFIHELLNRKHAKGPRIVSTMNRAVTPWRNYCAVWWTAWAVPLFWLVRLAQYVVYPCLTWLIRLPPYDDKDWVNVSRQKFEGLVGHDLIWCLYCDWMTGVWSLGSEMLRNVESFWCPIRFRSDKKCENCKIDFPDVETHWAPADGTMQDVVDLLAAQYPPPGEGEQLPWRPWMGHPKRAELTVKGEPPVSKPSEEAPAMEGE